MAVSRQEVTAMTFLHRVLIVFMSFIQFLAAMFHWSAGTPVDTMVKGNAPMTLLDREATDMADTVEYAWRVKNAAQAVYTDSARSAYRMSNAHMTLTHRLTGRVKTATLASPAGKVYAANTFESFYTDGSGNRRYFEVSESTGRVNTIRLGGYYYECHLRDLEQNGFWVDKVFHLYGDKLHIQYSLLSSVPTTAVRDFGGEIRIPAVKVASMVVKDARGTHSRPEADADTVEYAAFDIKNAGVVGFILPADGSGGRLCVEKRGAEYVITQYAPFTPGTGLNDNEENGGYDLNAVTFGCRVYTDDTHDFTGVARAAEEERNPLAVTVGKNNAHARYLGYEALRGCYLLRMDGTGFNEAYRSPDLRFAVPLTVENGGEGRQVYFRANGDNGCLEAAALLDGGGALLPVDVEVCKNFQGDGGEPFYSPRDYQYGDSFFPLASPAGSVDFTLLNLYQNWGKFPLKQLSSIEFHTSYYHLSTGVTESNCIAPYFVSSRDGWTLPDFRGRSGVMWSSQPQFNSVGILKFMTHKTLTGKEQLSEFAGSEIASCGPVYADVTDYYTDDAGRYTYSLRHVEMPQTDENRTYYTLKVHFTDNVTYTDFRRDFDLFYFDGRFVSYRQTGWLDESNAPVAAPVLSGEKPVYHTLGTDCPYFSFFDVTEDTAHYIDENFGSGFGLIVKDSRVVCGGKPLAVPLAYRENPGTGATSGSLTLDAGRISFKKGDLIELNLVLLPWGTGRETDDANVRAVREDSALHPVTLTAARGTVAPDALLPVVKCDGNRAEFTMTGGRNNVAVTVTGFTSLKTPRIEILRDGQWTAYEIASVHGYDGYGVMAGPDGACAFSFIVPTDGGEQTLRVTQ